MFKELQQTPGWFIEILCLFIFLELCPAARRHNVYLPIKRKCSTGLWPGLGILCGRENTCIRYGLSAKKHKHMSGFNIGMYWIWIKKIYTINNYPWQVNDLPVLTTRMAGIIFLHFYFCVYFFLYLKRINEKSYVLVIRVCNVYCLYWFTSCL